MKTRADSQDQTTPKVGGNQVAHRYEPSPYMKRVIMFNRELERNYQAIRKAHHKAVYGELTDNELLEWDKRNKQDPVTDLQPSDAQSQDNSHSKAKG